MLVLKTQPREIGLSKGELNKLRKQGKVPACLYGAGVKNENFFIDKVEYEKIFAKEGKIFETEVAGKKHLTNAKEVQISPVMHDLVHVSFVKLRKGEKTTVVIPVQTLGTAPGEDDGGNVAIVYEKVKIDGVPSKIPSYFDVDISDLQAGGSIQLKDIKLPEGIELHETEDPEQTVVNCNRPSLKEEEPAEEAETEGETPEAVEAAAPSEEGEEQS